MYRIFNAKDRVDGQQSSFFVHKDGRVAVNFSAWRKQNIIDNNYELAYDPETRINDMVDPVIIAEWE